MKYKQTSKRINAVTMWKNLLLTLFIVVTLCGILIEARNRNESRCYNFTWLGSRFHNESVFMNATCRDSTRLATGIPCQQPLVVSYDGTWPDVEYIWTHHAEQATCVLADNDVCARYTFYFNGQVENSTYMCTRAVDSNNTAITNGCFQESQGSFSTRVCFCRSVPGTVPCNSAAPLSFLFTTTIFLIIANLFCSLLS